MALEISHAVIRLTDLLIPGEFTIKDLHATDVTFLGPVVIVFQGDVRFEGTGSFLGTSFSALTWEIPADRQAVSGAVIIENAVFDDCKFLHVGVAGHHEALTAIAERFTVSD